MPDTNIDTIEFSKVVPATEPLDYEQWEPAYMFGWLAGMEPNSPSFEHCELDLRQQWEQLHPGSFSMYRHAIHSGFEDAYVRRPGPRMM